MRFLFKNILLNFYLILQIFAVSMGLLCGSFSYAKTNIAKENIPSKVEKVKNSVVRLRVKKKNGTGFILEDGILVTNSHAILDYKNRFFYQANPYPLSQIKIFQEDRLLDIQITGIQALDSIHDLVLLNIKGDIPPAMKVDLKKEQLFLVGYPDKKAL